MAAEQNNGCFFIIAVPILALWFLSKIFGSALALGIGIAIVAIYIIYYLNKCSREAAAEKAKEPETQNKSVRSKYLKSLDDLLADDTKSKKETLNSRILYDAIPNAPKITPIDLSAPKKTAVVSPSEIKVVEHAQSSHEQKMQSTPAPKPVKSPEFPRFESKAAPLSAPLPVVAPCLTSVRAESKPVLHFNSSKSSHATSSDIPAPKVTHKETYVRLFQNQN